MSNERGNQILRQWLILRACLSEQGPTVEDLVRTLRTGRRTIYRDLAILKKAGANLETKREGAVIRYISKQPFFQPLETVTSSDTPTDDSNYGRNK